MLCLKTAPLVVILTLKSVKAASFWDLDLSGESRREVLVHNAITCSEKGKYVLDKMLFVAAQLFPVSEILRQVNLFYCPKARLIPRK